MGIEFFCHVIWSSHPKEIKYFVLLTFLNKIFLLRNNSTKVKCDVQIHINDFMVLLLAWFCYSFFFFFFNYHIIDKVKIRAFGR